MWRCVDGWRELLCGNRQIRGGDCRRRRMRSRGVHGGIRRRHGNGRFNLFSIFRAVYTRALVAWFSSSILSSFRCDGGGGVGKEGRARWEQGSGSTRDGWEGLEAARVLPTHYEERGDAGTDKIKGITGFSNQCNNDTVKSGRLKVVGT